MALPYTDAFTNTNGTSLTTHSANWTHQVGSFVINTNSVCGNEFVECLAFINSETFGANQYAQATLVAASASQDLPIGVSVRVNTSTTDDGYALYYTPKTPTPRLILGKIIAGSHTEFATYGSMSTGQAMKLTASGTTLEVFKAGTSQGTQTDSTLSSGAAGLSAYGSTTVNRIDDFEGGNLSAALVAAGITTGAPVVGAPTIKQVHKLTSAGIATGAPVLAAPTLAEAGGEDALVAAGIATGAPTLGAPTIGQVHKLTSAGIATAAPTLAAPTIGQKHALTSAGVATAAPVVGAPSIGQQHKLTSAGIATAAPTVGAPTVGQKHALASTVIVTGAPVLAAPTIGQIHALVSAGVTTGAPVLGAPTVSTEGTDALEAAGIATGAPVVGAPAIGQTHKLTSAGIATSAPVVGQPAIGQIHAITANGITTGAPELTNTIMGQVHALVSAGIAAGAAVLGVPTLAEGAGGVVALSALGITTGAPRVGHPQLHILTFNRNPRRSRNTKRVEIGGGRVVVWRRAGR